MQTIQLATFWMLNKLKFAIQMFAIQIPLYCEMPHTLFKLCISCSDYSTYIQHFLSIKSLNQISSAAKSVLSEIFLQPTFIQV